jgi:phenylacetate-coenzyme A ligase PaaK-like adenylate-forming protein
MSYYSFVCEKLLLPMADYASCNHVMHYYKLFRKMQWMDRGHLQKYQDIQLSEMVRIAYEEVPFYRKLYDIHGVNVASITSTSELHLLPVVTKDMLRAAYPDMCTRRTKWPWREYCTSGSSGNPFAVRVDNETMSMARALMFLRANYAGWNIGEPFLQTGMTLERGVTKKLKDRILRVEYSSAFDLSDQILDAYLNLIDRKRLNYVMGYAGSLYLLAVRASVVGFNRTLKGLVSWGDNLYEHYRREIESAFKCRVTDTYGCGEGIQIAAQCGMKNGIYHVFMPHVAVEIVDDENYAVGQGEVGNVLLTRLDPGAMPLIRYQVGDLGIKSFDETCPCGRGFEMLSKIEGRDTDVVVTPRGNRLIVHFFTGIFEYYKTINTFKVVQEERDSITIFIVPGPDFRRDCLTSLKAEILEKGDPDLKIIMEIVKEIPLEKSNKRRFVISKLSQA